MLTDEITIRVMGIPAFGDWMRERLGIAKGQQWVLARRTKRIVEKYGEGVVCITKERYHALECEYRKKFIEPVERAIILNTILEPGVSLRVRGLQ